MKSGVLTSVQAHRKTFSNLQKNNLLSTYSFVRKKSIIMKFLLQLYSFIYIICILILDLDKCTKSLKNI